MISHNKMTIYKYQDDLHKFLSVKQDKSIQIHLYYARIHFYTIHIYIYSNNSLLCQIKTNCLKVSTALTTK